MKRIGPVGTLFAITVVVSAVQTVYIAADVPPSQAAVALASLALSFALACWVVADAHLRARVPCHDFGFLVVVFPVSLLWYVFWSRGRRGLVTLAALLGLFLLPVVAAVAASVLKVVIG